MTARFLVTAGALLSCTILGACNPAQNQGDVVVTSPLPNQQVTSPLTVTGRARGTWFFEASLPIQLVDYYGNQIAIGSAQAQGEWMTEDFVDFTGVLTFEASVPSGKLIIRKDNPSGLPEHDAEFEVPLTF